MDGLSEAALRRLAELGSTGSGWIETLPATLAALEVRWGCHIGEPFGKGSASFVASAVSDDGRACAVKLAIPAGGTGYSTFERELTVLSAAPADLYP